MKVLLINPPYMAMSENEDIFPPLNLAYIAAVLQQNNHQVTIYDAIPHNGPTKYKDGYWYGKTYNDIENDLNKLEFDIVGVGCFFSIRLKYALDVAKTVKKIKDVPVMLGGIHATTMPKEVMQNKEIDYIILGEGEVTVVKLLDAIINKTPINFVDGLAFRRDNEVVVHMKSEFVCDLDSLPLPARDLLDMEYYVTHGGFRWDLGDGRQTSVITSRGCPFKCAFCNMYMINGRMYRARSPEKVVDEIEDLINKYNIAQLSFEDDNLTFDKERMIKICKLMIKKNLNIQWNTPNGISVRNMDKETLLWMKKAGCVSINLAIESGDPYILNQVIKKGLSLDQVRNVANWCKELGLITNAYFVLGMPGETKQSVNNTIRYANSIHLDKIAIFFATPFPGTTLYDECLNKGYIDKQYVNHMTEQGYLLYDEPVIETEHLSKTDLLKSRRKFFISFMINKVVKNPVEGVEMFKDFMLDKNFRGKVFVALKRYVGLK